MNIKHFGVLTSLLLHSICGVVFAELQPGVISFSSTPTPPAHVGNEPYTLIAQWNLAVKPNSGQSILYVKSVELRNCVVEGEWVELPDKPISDWTVKWSQIPPKATGSKTWEVKHESDKCTVFWLFRIEFCLQENGETWQTYSQKLCSPFYTP